MRVDSYFGDTNKFNSDNWEITFIKVRQKIIKFFGIDLDKFESLKVNDNDFNYIEEEKLITYRSIIKLMKVFLLIYIY